MKSIVLNASIACFVLLSSCSKMIDYSPYDIDIERTTLNNTNTAIISNNTLKSKDTLKFAVISDSHKWYDQLHEAVNSINEQDGIHFVVCLGDITNWGNAQEYEWYLSEVKRLKYPIITLIGNHDYLGNGSKVYKRMFGDTNFTFKVEDYTFIAFDDIVWEKNNEAPDFEWLDKQFKSNSKNILLSHIPVWSNQLNETNNAKFDSVLQKNTLIMALHGHDHTRYDTIRYNIHHEVIGSMESKSYAIVSLFDNNYKIKHIQF